MNYDQIQEFLDNQIKESGITNRFLSVRLGLNETYISSFGNKRIVIGFDNLNKIANYFGYQLLIDFQLSKLEPK